MQHGESVIKIFAALSLSLSLSLSLLLLIINKGDTRGHRRISKQEGLDARGRACNEPAATRGSCLVKIMLSIWKICIHGGKLNSRPSGVTAPRALRDFERF